MALTAEQIADGWIEHDGGECPVPLWERPGVIFSSGGVYEPGHAKAAAWGDLGHGRKNLWKHEDPDMRIIAYKLTRKGPTS